MDAMGGFLNSIPVVGHVKGVLHYALGDVSGGNEAMFRATRWILVLAGGIAGAIFGVPVGMAVGTLLAKGATNAWGSDDAVAREPSTGESSPATERKSTMEGVPVEVISKLEAEQKLGRAPVDFKN